MSSSFFSENYAGLQVVQDNAKCHAPFREGSAAAEARSRALGLEDDAASNDDPISPGTGLTRWGSQEDLISNSPRQPSRRSADHSPPPPAASWPPTTEHRPWNQHHGQGQSTPGCRWNSQICRDDEMVLGKISLSPSIPRRCLEDVAVAIAPSPPSMIDDIRRNKSIIDDHEAGLKASPPPPPRRCSSPPLKSSDCGPTADENHLKLPRG